MYRGLFQSARLIPFGRESQVFGHIQSMSSSYSVALSLIVICFFRLFSRT